MMMKFKLGTSFVFLLVNTFISQLFARDCFTSRGELGTCIEIRQCPRMVEILTMKPLLDESLKYLQQSQCHIGPTGPFVFICCPLYVPTTTFRPPNHETEISGSSPNFNLRHNSLLPSDCGRHTDDRIVGGERTDIDEFPWMVLLEYQKSDKIETYCGGVLISKRYVLTAAHCVKGLRSSVKLVGVRLGEYDKTQELDCIRQSGFRVCSDPVVSIPIEEQITYEDYTSHSTGQWNDIALLRLAQDVTFTNFIQPICLPQNSNVASLLDVAGWGVKENRTDSNVKLKVKIPLVGNEECDKKYRPLGIILRAGQICAGGQKGKDSCKGDSGGPLMSRVRGPNEDIPKWVSVGIVSFGPSHCGLEGWPGVYTKVYDFMPWILRNMRP